VFVDGPAGRLHAVDGGAGEPAIVLLPSLAGTARQWQNQADHLRRDHRAVVIELRGHGKSDEPRDGNYSLEAMASDVNAVAASLGLTRFVLVGHSMGGGAALAYAAAHPAMVSGVLLADPIDDPSRHPAAAMKPMLDRLQSADYAAVIEQYWNRILELARPEVKTAVLEDLRATPRATVLGTIAAIERWNASAALAKYPGPILSVITRFGDVPSALHKVSPRVRPVSIEGTSHWLQMDKPEEFNRVLDEFLAETSRR
jgi:pimeloyl-ACP methyl ester carboxylesterase